MAHLQGYFLLLSALVNSCNQLDTGPFLQEEKKYFVWILSCCCRDRTQAACIGSHRPRSLGRVNTLMNLPQSKTCECLKNLILEKYVSVKILDQCPGHFLAAFQKLFLTVKSLSTKARLSRFSPSLAKPESGQRKPFCFSPCRDIWRFQAF